MLRHHDRPLGRPAPPSWPRAGRRLVAWLAEDVSRRGARSRWRLAPLLAACGGVSGLVYLTGGTSLAFVQLMYLPVVLGGLLLGARAAILLGVCGGLLVGPIMPLSVAAGTPQPLYGWLLRLAVFVLVGALAGGFSGLLRERLVELRAVHDDLARSYGRTLKALASLVAERDQDTADHSERVAANACALGEALGFAGAELDTLYWAAILHDLGKIGVPEAILSKPGPLSPDEWAVMRSHAEIGARLLRNASSDFAPVAELVRAHHERWDGLGYPEGRHGEAIPLGARVLAVADVYEALTSPRPYRVPLAPDTVMAYLEDQAGTQFDPRVVAAFRGLFDTGRLAAQAPRAPRTDRLTLVPIETN